MKRDAVAHNDLCVAVPFVLAVALLPFAAAPAAAQFDDFACGACIHDEITHYWRIPEHSRFGNNFAIAQRCAAIEYPLPEFKVTCDGTQATEFELRHVDVLGTGCVSQFNRPKPYILNEFGEKLELPDPNFYGSIEVTELEERHLVFKYTHPTDPPPAGEVSRDIYIGIEYDWPQHDEKAMITTLLLHVYRPPVVMSHGLWADQESFAAMEEDFSSDSHHYPKELLYRVDYSGSNDAAFVDNIREAEFGVVSVIEQAADAGYAVGKVDLVGHSMGGILSRLYVQGFYYNHDVRRLITCNTPHAGSQMANWLLDELWDPYGVACSALEAGLGSCYKGAVCDLNVYSHGIHNLLNNPQNEPGDVQFHALTTVFDYATALPQGPIAAFVHANYPTLIQAILPFCSAPELLDDVFNGEDSDLVVAHSSQAGGKQGLLTSTFEDQIHIGSTANPGVIDEVRGLLDLPKNNDRFTLINYDPPALAYFTPSVCTIENSPARAFPAVSSSGGWPAGVGAAALQASGRSADCPTANHAAGSLRALAAASLTITSPAPGAVLNAGQGFSVTVTGSADVATIVLLLSYRGDELFLARLPGPAATFDLSVPTELIGEETLVALALDAGGQPVATSDTVSLNIAVPATLQSLAVYPAALHLDPGRTGRLHVTGSYGDGIERDLSDLTGLAFAFAEGHASKSGTSSVTLDERLDDTLTITYQGVTAPEVRIRALPPEQPRVTTRPVRRRLGRQ